MTSFTFAPGPDAAIAQDSQGVLTFAFERPQDGLLIDALVDRAFGPGRYAKTAERIRERARLRRDLSICAWSGEALAGAVRQWAILVGETPAVFLGPIAVDAAERHRGLGAGLMRRAVAVSKTAGERLILLVGDMSFFAQFGFQVVPPGRVLLPGPADPQRVLWLGLGGAGLDGVAGAVRPVREG